MGLFLAREVKEYKQNPDSYKGHVGDISTVIRVRLTGRCNTPDLYEIMKVLGKEEILRKTNMKRGFFETDNLRGRIWSLCKKTGLKIETMKGLGYHLIDRIFVND